MKTKLNSLAVIALAVAALSMTAPIVNAAGTHGQGHAAKIGSPGKAENATRTFSITMYDNYYEPEGLIIKEGKTVRFVVENKGTLVHEFTIATGDMHMAHGPEMMMMVEHGVLEADKINWDAAKKMQASMGHGMHNEPNSLLLEPGKSGEIIWTFPDHAELEFACNVPGHYDA